MPFLSRYRPFIVVASLYLLLMQLGFVVLALPGSLAGNADFRSFYAAGHLVRDGRRAQLYDSELAHSAEIQYVGYAGPILPFIHPSYEAALFALLSFFPYKTSFCLFFAINLALLALAFRLLSPPFAWLREAWPLLPAIAVAAFLPVGVCLIHGQDSILLLAILAGAYALDHRRREFAAGLLLGLGLFRFQLLLPLLLLLVFSRKWKFLYGFAASAVAVVAACVLVSGPEIFVAYPKALLAISGGLQTGAQKIAVSVWPETMPNLRGLFYLAFAGRIPHSALQIATLLSSLALLVWAACKRLPMELAVMVAILVSYHGGMHDSVLFLLPMLKLPLPPRFPAQVSLLVWFLLLSGATLATVFHLPHASVALLYFPFLFLFATGLKNSSSTPAMQERMALSS